MREINRECFFESSKKVLEEILNLLDNVPVLKLSDIKPDETTLVIVDMVNGFAREGALKSDRVEALIPNTVRLVDKCDEKGIEKIAFADSHVESCVEFDYYPPHCLRGTSEADMLREIKDKGNYRLFPKNSTNGFLEREFLKWLDSSSGINNFILAGDCTDICILQFALTMKAYFNIHNRRVNIYVPIDVVDTFELGMHNADLMNVFSLYTMLGNGVQVVKTVE
jgi:nicotinamidase-related amidase